MTIPLTQKRIAEFLCGDVKRGKECPHHEEMAADLLFVVQRAQKEEREEEAKKALDRLAKT